MEDANLYDALLARVVAAARPRDPFEWMLLKDYADLAWEIFRLRRVKADCVDGERRTAVYSLLKRLGFDAVGAWQSYNDPETKALVAKQLAEHGFDEQIIAHEAVPLVSGKLSALDATISAVEQRRNPMLRELDYHRVGLGTRLRAVPEVVDAEIEDVPLGIAQAESSPAQVGSARP